MCGINDQQIQKKLIAEKVLSFDKAMEIAVAVESTTKGARDITSGMPDNTPLHHVSDRTLPVIITPNVFTVAGVTTSPQNVILKMQFAENVIRKAT